MVGREPFRPDVGALYPQLLRMAAEEVHLLSRPTFRLVFERPPEGLSSSEITSYIGSISSNSSPPDLSQTESWAGTWGT